MAGGKGNFVLGLSRRHHSFCWLHDLVGLIMKNHRSSEDRLVKKTPYPTELEIILFLADVFDVREKGKRLYKESHKPFRHMYYELSDLVREIIETPLKKIMGRDAACEVGPELNFDDFSRGIVRCVFDYGMIVNKVNVGDLQRNELMPVLIEEVFVPLVAYFIHCNLSCSSLVRVAGPVFEEREFSEFDFMESTRGYLSWWYDYGHFVSEKRFPAGFPKTFSAFLCSDSVGMGKVGGDGFARMSVPSNSTISNFISNLLAINSPEPDEKVLTGYIINDVKWRLFFGAVFNRCVKKAERYVDKERLLSVVRDVFEGCSRDRWWVDLNLCKKKFSDRISSMLSATSGSSGSEPVCVRHLGEARRLLSAGDVGSAVDACVKAARGAAYSGGRQELSVVSEAFCLLAFVYRFGKYLWGSNDFGGIKLKSEMKYMKNVLRGACYGSGEADLSMHGVISILSRGSNYEGGGSGSEVVLKARAGSVLDSEINEGALRFAFMRPGSYGNAFDFKGVRKYYFWNYMALVLSKKAWRGRGRLEAAMKALPVVDGREDDVSEY